MYLGIDIGSVKFAATLLESLTSKRFLGEFANTQEGFQALFRLLPDTHVICCMEATGVYAEAISHFLYEKGVAVHIEPPHLVKAAFQDRAKTDPIDSRQLAEYAIRFEDKLHPWQPREVILEQLRILLTIKQHYTRISTSLKNARKALHHKHYRYTTAIELHEQMIDDLKDTKKTIKKEIDAIIQTNVILNHHAKNLQTIPGVGFWMMLQFLLTTEGFTQHLNPKQIAAYAGICPYPYESGTSVKRNDHADSKGPKQLRALLYLVAINMIKEGKPMQKYYQRKIAQGYHPKVVLNNIRNKILRIMCAVVIIGKPYNPNHQSLNPNIFTK